MSGRRRALWMWAAFALVCGEGVSVENQSLLFAGDSPPRLGTLGPDWHGPRLLPADELLPPPLVEVGDTQGPSVVMLVNQVTVSDSQPSGEADIAVLADSSTAAPPRSSRPVAGGVAGQPGERTSLLPRRRRTAKDLVLPESDEPATSVGVPLDEPAWGKADALVSQLEPLTRHPPTATWATAVIEQVVQISQTPAGRRAQVEQILDKLGQHVNQVPAMAESLNDPELKTDLLRARYALIRRLDLWDAVRAALAAGRQEDEDEQEKRDGLLRRITGLASLTDDTPQGRAWREYLLLDSLQEAPAQHEGERRRIARAVLGRLAKARISPAHRRFLSREPVDELDASLRRMAAVPVDLDQLTSLIDRYETTSAPADAARLAESLDSLVWAHASSAQQQAKTLRRHYRNANIRLAVSRKLIDRMMPQPQVDRGRVSDVILGAQVAGCSQTATRLTVKTQPQRGSWKLLIEATGTVDSDTASTSGPATFRSTGRTSFYAVKPVIVRGDHVEILPARATARSNSDLRSVKTEFDGVPVVGSLIREIARTQHKDSYPKAMNEVERKVAGRVIDRLDREVPQHIRNAESKLYQQVVHRLLRLEMEAAPIELTTTDQRMVARYRLSTDQQLGAHTPRPRAPSDSLVSLQLHESSINNILAQLDLAGRSFTLPELYRHISARLGVEVSVPEDTPQDVRLTFAAQDPLVVHFREGRIQIELTLAELARDDDRFHDFQVTAFYRPDSDQLQLTLSRDGTIFLKGDSLNFRAQIALRGVFSKVFSQNRHAKLLSEKIVGDQRLADLEITQLALEDGWLGVAVGPQRDSAGRTARVGP